MVKVAWVLTLAVTLGALGACGESSNSTDDETSGSTGDSGGSGSTGGSGGSGGGGGGPNGLSGTWDVIISQPNGEASPSTVTLSPTLLEVAGKLEVVALVIDEVITIAYDGEAARATRVSEADMNLGVIPLPLAGVLRFTGVPDEGNGCDYNLSRDSLSLLCSEGVSGAARDLESEELVAQREEPLESIFGDLGGRWTVVVDDADCSVVLANDTIGVDCVKPGREPEEANITVGSDRITGSTSAGLEFTAQRR